MVARPARAPRLVTAAESIDASNSPFEESEVVFDCPQQTILVELVHETAAARLLLYCCFTQDRARVQATNNIAANDSSEHRCHAPDRGARNFLVEPVGRRG